MTSHFGLVFCRDHRWVQNADWGQWYAKSEVNFSKFGLGDRSAIRRDQTLDSAIVETKVNPNFPHYTLLVLHGRDMLILLRLSFAELKPTFRSFRTLTTATANNLQPVADIRNNKGHWFYALAGVHISNNVILIDQYTQSNQVHCHKTSLLLTKFR